MVLCCWFSLTISTHALTWRATPEWMRLSLPVEFLPTPSHGGRRRQDFITNFIHLFLPTPLTWRATISWSSNTLRREFLPTPSHGGRRDCMDGLAKVSPISTHALTWRATCPPCCKTLRQHISTHALTWRATSCDMIIIEQETNFYPRPHMEGDRRVYGRLGKSLISTHALTWRGDGGVLDAAAASGEISTHALTWRTVERCVIDRRIFSFLPTPSHGGRHRRPVRTGFVNGISTHALTWRATGVKDGFNIILWNFYPRPHMEGDTCVTLCRRFFTNFYPRPHMEGDSKHAEVQACISAAYLKCSTRKAAASRRCAGLGGRVVLFHQLSRLVLGRARCEPRGEGMCDRGSHRRSAILKVHSSRMSSWLH